MYKVLIVEDEWLVREGLKQTIPWEQVGCELVGEASDGLAALELIERLEPDIVLSDIRMPGLDGIGLAERLSLQHPQLKIVFLTGFDDFVIAQKAIKLGAADFVLKPTNPDELLDVLGRIKAKLDEEHTYREQSERMELRLVLGQPFIMEKLLYDMMLDHAGTFELELFNEYCSQGKEISGALRVVLLNSVIPETELARAWRTEQWQKAAAVGEKLTSFPLVRVGKTGYALLADRMTQRTDMDPLLQLLVGSVQPGDERLSVGISTCHHGVESIAAAYDEALQALYGTFWNDGRRLLWYEDLQSPSMQALSGSVTESP